MIFVFKFGVLVFWTYFDEENKSIGNESQRITNNKKKIKTEQFKINTKFELFILTELDGWHAVSDILPAEKWERDSMLFVHSDNSEKKKIEDNCIYLESEEMKEKFAHSYS